MKKALSLLLVIILALSIPMTAYAQVSGITYDCANGYTSIKLSHPDTYSGEVDGLIEYNGKNDRGQNYAWSSVGYGDYIYVGTCFGAIYQTLRIIAMENGMEFSQMKDLINALYNGDLYIGDKGEEVTANRSFVVKINTKTYETSIVEGPVKSGGYRAATKFNDKLYFAATGATPYILEIDPNNNDAKQIVCYSETPQSASISTGIRGLTVYRDMLVATMIGNNGAYMVASSDPSSGPESFVTIGTQEDFLDYPAYHYMDSIFGGSIWDIIEYNDKLYITVVTGKNGNKQAFAMFSGQPDENGEWSYDLIVGNENDGAKYPFGLGSDRSGAANLMVYDGYLYIGGYNDPMVALPEVLDMNFANLYKDLSSPVCLWRLDENDNIEMVAGEKNEVFPNGPIGNMGAGFGSNMNQYVWRMENYNGKLFLGTFDIGSLAYPLMQFTNGDVLNMSNEDLEQQIEYIQKVLGMFGAPGTQFPIFPRSSDIAQTSSNTELSQLSKCADELAQLSDSMDDDSLESRLDIYNILAELSKEYQKIKHLLPGQVTQILDELLAPETIENFGYFVKCCEYLSKGERGFDLFVSEDGINFDVLTRDGFGDPYNHGCRVFAITNSGLCIGTANPFYGAQVWLIDENESTMLGDVNENGKVDIMDATLIQRHLAKFSQIDDDLLTIADVDKNNEITVLDATIIQRYLASIITEF
ncbi:MAG: dockerin type I repeat-containing protein [Ruminococcus sp.]|nr:dockerin type I repeat-containing protein [Ruminococcus sp.]